MKKTVKKTQIEEAPVAEAPAPEETDVTIGAEYATIPQLATVQFDTDKAELREDARATLKKNAVVLKVILAEVPKAEIRIEGHCDERSTLEYNLALGQRRANAVKNYYGALGIKKSALTTISYGEEKPVCQESREECWWRNRRGETTVRSVSGPVRIPREKLSSIQ